MEEEVKVVASEEVVEAPAPKKGASKKSLLIRNIVYSGLIFLMLFMPLFVKGSFVGLPITFIFAEDAIYLSFMGCLGAYMGGKVTMWIFMAIYLIFFAVSIANLGLSIAALFTDKLDKVRKIVSKITFIVSIVAGSLLTINFLTAMFLLLEEFVVYLVICYPIIIWITAAILQAVVSKKTEKSL